MGVDVEAGAATATETERARLPGSQIPETPEIIEGTTHDWRHWTDEPWVLFVVLGAAFIMLTGTIQLVHPLDRDEGAFLVIAQGILHGRVPYRDVFDHKSPAIYYLFAALLALTSQLSLMAQIVTLRLVVAVANLISAAGLVALGRRWKSLEVGALAAALWLVALPFYAGVYAFTEPFAVAATIWALVVASRRQPTWRTAAGTGLLLTLAALFKQTAVLALPAAMLILYCGLLPERRWRPPLRPLLTHVCALLAGLVVPWLLVAGAFTLAGAGGPLVQDVVVANLHYPPDTPIALVEGIIVGVDTFPFLWFTALLVTCLGGWTWLRRRSQARGRLNPGLAAAGLAGLLNLIPFMSHTYPHYWLQVLPWTALLSAYVIMSAVERWRPARWMPDDERLSPADRTLRRLVLPVLFGVVIATSSSSSLFVTAHLDTASGDLHTQIAAGAWIRERVPPSARLLVAPAAPELYYLSGHRPVTSYIYLLPVNLTPALIAQVTGDLQRGAFDAVVWQLDLAPGQPAVDPALRGVYAMLTARYHVAATYPADNLQLFVPTPPAVVSAPQAGAARPAT